uniref:Uncharacterized protein n=1 Tax=Caenorhabditis japonica TaxID=281687 RepID=A0A8R1I376_CAEJA
MSETSATLSFVASVAASGRLINETQTGTALPCGATAARGLWRKTSVSKKALASTTYNFTSPVSHQNCRLAHTWFRLRLPHAKGQGVTFRRTIDYHDGKRYSVWVTADMSLNNDLVSASLRVKPSKVKQEVVKEEKPPDSELEVVAPVGSSFSSQNESWKVVDMDDLLTTDQAIRWGRTFTGSINFSGEVEHLEALKRWMDERPDAPIPQLYPY